MRLPLVEDPRPLEPIATPSSKTWPVYLVVGAVVAGLLWLGEMGWWR